MISIVPRLAGPGPHACSGWDPTDEPELRHSGDGPALLPPQPKSVAETGLELAMIVALIGKAIFIGGKRDLPQLTAQLRLSINVLREALDFMVTEQLAEVAWRGPSDIDVQYHLTTVGKQRAGAWLERSAYLGPAPVTLAAYQAQVARQAWRRLPGGLSLGPADMAAALGPGGSAPATLEQLGAALHSGRAMLLYGPPGGGKSLLARQLGSLLSGVVAVPHALLVGQEIVTLADPLLHLAPTPLQALHARPALERRSSDSRWLLCQRPLVLTGAELDLAALELCHDGYSGAYAAPPQLKANNGILVIDDLGRQPVPAAALLNRLLAPHAAGQDSLTLRGGQRLTLPFETQLVFATNLAPRLLLEAALLRRLAYQIELGPLPVPAYQALFTAECGAAGLAVEPATLACLLDELHGGGAVPLLACYPRELLGRVADFAAYAGRVPQLTPAALRQAWASLMTGGAP